MPKYVNGEPDVIERLRQVLPNGWRATLCAVDGSTTCDIASQIETIPEDTTHLVVSIGGNDAMLRSDILDTPVVSTAEALTLFVEASSRFEEKYRRTITMILGQNLPTILCTIYNGGFSEDVILRVATQNRLPVIELRTVCDAEEDYANPIEPSTIGAAKIAQRIIKAVIYQNNSPAHTFVLG